MWYIHIAHLISLILKLFIDVFKRLWTQCFVQNGWNFKEDNTLLYLMKFIICLYEDYIYSMVDLSYNDFCV